MTEYSANVHRLQDENKVARVPTLTKCAYEC